MPKTVVWLTSLPKDDEPERRIVNDAVSLDFLHTLDCSPSGQRCAGGGRFLLGAFTEHRKPYKTPRLRVTYYERQQRREARGNSGEEERYTGCNPGTASGRITGMLCIEIGFKGAAPAPLLSKQTSLELNLATGAN